MRPQSAVFIKIRMTESVHLGIHSAMSLQVLCSEIYELETFLEGQVLQT